MAEQINRLPGAGATSVILSPVSNNAAEELKLCAELVLPQVAR
ncbi:hypothetical protein [Nocardioides sp. B-3]|nr:hypothetical protein [Nocardioides sp. B-3]